MKRTCSIRFDVEFKNILMWDHFYMVAFDTRPLLVTSNGNTYIVVAIDHYSN
jgi:hypothetical protein